MKKHFLTVVYAIDDKPETVEAILAQRPWQAVAHTDALKDLEHAQADLDATIDGYDAARLEIESLQARVQEHVRSGKDWAMRVEALERTITTLRAQITTLREENASLQQRDDDWHKEHSNALVEIAILKAAKADARHDIDDLTERDESQRLRIAELEAQLEAIGAGGVEPLRKRECLHQIIEPAPSEWDVRGHLAESLTCWPRLTGQEASELVELFQGRESQALASAPIDADVQRDAERYRWLRKQHWNEAVLCVVAQPKKALKLGFDCPSLDRLDCFIDAASAAQVGV